MVRRLRSSVHSGGPLGWVGMAAMAGAAGLITLSAGNMFTAPEPEDARQTAAAAGKALSNTTERLKADIRTPLLKDKGSESDLPVIPAQATGSEVTFIVRLKGAPEVDTIARNFKRNRPAAMEAYAELVRTRPALKDFRLVGASYSGEITLAYALPPGTEPTRATIMGIQKRILSVEGVAYADPDYIAHPGKEP